MNDPSKHSGKTIKLAERRVFSNSFKPLYSDGMSLVEQTAEYLDGEGRVQAKGSRALPLHSTPPNPCG